MSSREARPRPAGAVRVTASLIVACAWLVAAAAGETEGADRASDKGKTVYLRYCVSCHGQGARGDGPLAKDLRVAVADLTTLAARNAGHYPSERIQKTIESGEPLRGHGTHDMPAWGDAFKKTGGIEASTPEEAIRNLTEYIRSLQRQEGKSSP
jgi:mono/diheme cytochrome c family protein